MSSNFKLLHFRVVVFSRCIFSVHFKPAFFGIHSLAAVVVSSTRFLLKIKHGLPIASSQPRTPVLDLVKVYIDRRPK